MKTKPISQSFTGQNTVIAINSKESVDVEGFLGLIRHDDITKWVANLDELLWLMVDYQRLSESPYDGDYLAELYYNVRLIRDAFSAAEIPSVSSPSHPASV